MNNETQTLSDFSQLVSDHYNELTKSEKSIADYLRQNQDEAAFLSAAEVAAQLNLSEATMVRFARTLGFSSYPAMREVLQETFRRRVTHSARLLGRLDDLRQAGDIFERLVASEIDYLTHALETVDPKPGVCIRGRAIGIAGRLIRDSPGALRPSGYHADDRRKGNSRTTPDHDRDGSLLRNLLFRHISYASACARLR
jgi:hypothetical protein